MTLRAKLEEVVNKIEKYSYTPNAIYLYPLNEYLHELKNYFDFKSDNTRFNEYIDQVLLPGFYYYLELFEKTNSANAEHDVKIIKEGTAYWLSHFKYAFTTFSVKGLDHEFK